MASSLAQDALRCESKLQLVIELTDKYCLFVHSITVSTLGELCMSFICLCLLVMSVNGMYM